MYKGRQKEHILTSGNILRGLIYCQIAYMPVTLKEKISTWLRLKLLIVLADSSFPWCCDSADLNHRHVIHSYPDLGRQQRKFYYSVTFSAWKWTWFCLFVFVLIIETKALFSSHIHSTSAVVNPRCRMTAKAALELLTWQNEMIAH